MDVFVARQPIFNREKEIVAYELLYRNSLKNFFDPSVNSSKATSTLIANSYINIGLNNLIEDKKAFINFDSTLINNGTTKLLDKHKVVIEVLETVVPDRELISNLLELKSLGYTLALDDFTPDYPYMNTLVLYDIVKVDFILSGLNGAKKIIDKYSNGKRKFLAEKIETQKEFKKAMDMGYDYFQGYFFTKPEILTGKASEGFNFQFVRLKAAMDKKEPDFNEISQIIEKDISLSYKLLKLVNSFSLSSEITSIRHAISMLGIKEIEKWISLIMITDFVPTDPSPIVKLSVVRSRFAEQLAANSNKRNQMYQASFVGLFSMIDVILNRRLNNILNEMPMKKDVKEAILQRPGSSLYDVLQIVLCYEKSNWEQMEIHAKNIGLNPDKIPSIYMESLSWANKYISAVNEISEDIEENKNENDVTQ